MVRLTKWRVLKLGDERRSVWTPHNSMYVRAHLSSNIYQMNIVVFLLLLLPYTFILSYIYIYIYIYIDSISRTDPIPSTHFHGTIKTHFPATSTETSSKLYQLPLFLSIDVGQMTWLKSMPCWLEVDGSLFFG